MGAETAPASRFRLADIADDVTRECRRLVDQLWSRGLATDDPVLDLATLGAIAQVTAAVRDLCRGDDHEAVAPVVSKALRGRLAELRAQAEASKITRLN